MENPYSYPLTPNNFCNDCLQQGTRCTLCLEVPPLEALPLIDYPENEFIINNIINNNNIINPYYIIRYINDLPNNNFAVRRLFQEFELNIPLNSITNGITEPTFECAICLEYHSSTIAITFNCGHKFCANTTCPNLRRSMKCPLCRSSITSLSLTRSDTTPINIRINEDNDEFQCMTCENRAQCELDCLHRYCGNCTVNHLHTSGTSLCQECSTPITTIKI